MVFIDIVQKWYRLLPTASRIEVNTDWLRGIKGCLPYSKKGNVSIKPDEDD